jgi:plasmid stabilization system protein ParE
MEVLYTRRAQRDLKAIFSRIVEDRPTAASSVVARIESFIVLRSEFPDIGRPVGGSGTKSVPISDLPYRIFFRVASGRMQILQIRHAHRRPLKRS